MAPGALLTDLYELNMAASYLLRGMMQDAVTPVDTSGMVPGSSMSSTEGLAKIAEALVGRHKESQALQGTNGTSSQFDPLGSVYRGVKGILGF